MKHIAHALAASALVFATAPVAYAQGGPPPLGPEQLRDRALEYDTVAWDITEGLTTEVGPRQAGTEAEARARAWAVEKLTELGFSNVRNEPYMMDTWVRGAESARIVSPFAQPMVIAALGNSAATPAEGLTAEVIYFPTYADLAAAPAGSLAGKIAFISHDMQPTQDGFSYGFAGPVRWTGPALAASKGAVAAVIKSVGTDTSRAPHAGGTGWAEGQAPIPAGALSVADALNLERMFERRQPITMHLTLTPRQIGMQPSGNVIAEVPGSDPDAGMIVLACHLDSWDLGTGAIDDASGCGIITAAAKAIMDHGARPRRTIRLLWAGAEEVGIWGGRAYAEAHAGEKHALAMESDFGAGRVWKVDFNLANAELQAQVAQLLAPLGVVRGTDRAGGGADIGPIIAETEPAIVDLNQDGTEYFDLHHTPEDTLDKVDPEDLRQNVAAWVATVALLAGAPGELSPAPEAD